MNTKYMLLGGLAAGVLINVSEVILNVGILMDEYQAILETHDLTEPSWAVSGFLAGGFLLGLVVAWLYAAIRPRFGPGWGTGIRAGVALWIVGFLVPGVWMGAMGLSFGAGATTLAGAWELVEVALAGVVAGWIYREE